MSIPIDAIALRKLVFIKQLYQHAVMQADSATNDLSRTLVVIEYDLANETCLRVALVAMNAPNVPFQFHELISDLDKQLPLKGCNPVPDKPHIKQVHDIRNDAQHKLKYPSAIEMNDCRTYSRDFLQTFIGDIWGKDFASISLVETIRHGQVKDYLIKAEIALAQSDYQSTIDRASEGMEWAMILLGRVLFGRLPNTASSAFQMVDNRGDIKPFHEGRDALEALRKMRDTLITHTLGLNHIEHEKYREIADHIQFGGDGSPHFYRDARKTSRATRENAEFIVAYCVETIARIEGQVGNLEKPFGLDR